MTQEMTTSVIDMPRNETYPRFDIAAAMQTVLAEVKDRDFELDVQQEEGCLAIGEALLDGVDSGYVEMATSTGKTVIASLLTEAAVRAGKRVLMLAPSTAICRQLHGVPQELADDPTGLDKFTPLHHTARVGAHFANQRTGRDAQVVITTYRGFLVDYKKDNDVLGQFDVVLADECHRSLGPTISSAIKTVYPGAFKVGFSATPDYGIDRTSKEVFDKQLFEFSLTKAIEDGRTAPVRALIYETDDTLRLSDQRKEFTERELAPLMHSMQRNGTVLELCRAFVDDGRQGVVACIPGNNNAHARYVSDMLRRSGMRAASIGQHQSANDNHNRAQLFNMGGLDVLTFTGTGGLKEGWHSIRTSFAINACPTGSEVRTKQLLGRVLGKKPDGLESIYVDFVDRKQGIAKSQYTAMHALGLDRIDMMRVVGRHGANGTNTPKPLKPLGYVSEEVYRRLLNSQGKLLSDITVREAENPLFKEWEKTLTKEGLSADLQENDVLPLSLIRQVKQASDSYLEAFGEHPTDIAQIADYLDIKARHRQRAVAEYAFRVEFDEDELSELPIDPRAETASLAEASVLEDQIFGALGSLSLRRAQIICMTFGLGGCEEMSMKEQGLILGISGARIGQELSKALSMLRHPSRSDRLRDFHIM